MLDRRCLSVLSPVRRNCPHAMRANRHNALHVTLLQSLKIIFSELTEHKIVTEPARGISGTVLLPQHAETGAQIPHYPAECRDDLAAPRIVRAHAAKPQAVFLCSIVDRQLLLLNKLIPFG